MLVGYPTLIGLLISTLICFVLLVFIQKTAKSGQLKTGMILGYICMLIVSVGQSLQILLGKKLNIPLIYYDYIVYIGTVFLPITIYAISKIYTNTVIKIKKGHLLLLVIPILSLISLWTNDFHHLFFKVYSIYMYEGEAGPFMAINSIYSYVLLGAGVYNLLKFSIKNAGFFSKQSLLFVMAILPPVLGNLLGTLKLFPMTIYFTPMLFTFSLMFITLAILKFNLLEVAPIALQTIVNRISDSYLVLNDSDIITDFNKPLLDTFGVKENDLRNKDIMMFLKKSEYKINVKKFSNTLKKAKESSKTQRFNETFAKIEKTFTIEISDLVTQGKYLGCIVLFKDITQHIQDMETIKNNQDMLIERERLASLGQMIGGISHNLKTPIFSIAGGLEAIHGLVEEYKASIDAPQVTKEDMYAIGDDIDEWIDKLKNHLEYMSDIITAVKGQAVTFSENSIVSFGIAETFKHVEILMQHDLKHSLTNLNVTNDVPEEITLKGNMNGLVQVIDNLISNAIYAYKSMNKTDQVIDLSAKYIKSKHHVEIRVKDYGPGLPKEVQNKLFKEMITTKGKEGTGLGLFMSASNIKAQFKGSLDFETKEGKGTTFIISLPILEIANS